MPDGGRFDGGMYSGVGEARRRADFLRGLLADGPARIIDTAAGVGDLAFLLASAGDRVLAFEPCGERFAVLFDRFCRQPDVHHLLAVLPQRLEDYPLRPEADAVVASNHWSHMPRADRAAFLGRAHAALRPGGLLVMNCPQDTLLRVDQPRDEIHRRVCGDLVIRHFASSHADASGRDRRVRFEYRIEHLGQPVQTVTEEYTLALTTPAEARALLAAAGFGGVRVHGGYDDVGYDESSPGFVIVAERPPAD
jgi:SAM-dependent methyltransferase